MPSHVTKTIRCDFSRNEIDKKCKISIFCNFHSDSDFKSLVCWKRCECDKKWGISSAESSSLIDTAEGKKPRLYDFGEAFEIDLSHEFQLYTFAARSSSDNFSLTLQSKLGNLTLFSSTQSHIYFFPSFSLCECFD